MSDKCYDDIVMDVVFSAIDEINQQLPKEGRLAKNMKTALYGRDGILDSLGLVTFIVALEQKIEERLGVTIMLADERIMAKDSNPFSSVGAITAHIITLLEEKQGDGQKV